MKHRKSDNKDKQDKFLILSVSHFFKILQEAYLHYSLNYMCDMSLNKTIYSMTISQIMGLNLFFPGYFFPESIIYYYLVVFD